MTAVTKYAGAFEFDELEAEVRKGFRKVARRSPQASTSTDNSVTGALRFDAILRFGVVNLACFALLAAAWAFPLCVWVCAPNGARWLYYGCQQVVCG